MLTPKPQLNLSNARGYFREHLAVGDYYMDGHVVAGEWRGVGAALFGLEGPVSEDAFIKLCEGLNPETGQWLTARRNTTRREQGRDVSNRRVFYDFTISPPKSVSVVALYQDARIIDIHDRAARVMVDELEKFAETRVRKDGENGERVTGGVIAALFRHDTSRELDPHLHTHCVFMNATYDSVEDRWKALHATGMYRAQKFAENLYYHELAKGLRSLGYEIENNARDFEIKGVPAEVISRFSKRHRQIDAEAKKRIAEEGLVGGIRSEKALRERIAHDRRRRKIKSACAEKLRPRWEAEMPAAERSALDAISPRNLPPLPSPLPGALSEKPDMPALLAWVDAHLFERNAVLADHQLLAAALARGRGENFSLAELEQAVVARGYAISTDGRKVTNREALLREWHICLAVEKGAGRHAPLNLSYKPHPALSDEQRKAVRAILESRDFITAFRGGAGTGKSFTLTEIVCGLKAGKHAVLVAAPQHQQAADLRRDGLRGATTLAHLLTGGAGEALPPHAVVVVDEAGQVGGRDMLALIERVQACGGRIILSGDTRQQGAVAATDALRVMEENTNLRPVCLRQIHRQDPALGRTRAERRFIKNYREAVRAAADGDPLASFARLDALGCIRELDSEALKKEVAREYCAALARNERVLAVAQTWTEVRELNAAIRERLKNAGRLREGAPVVSWQAVDLTGAQKCDARFYPKNARVCFVRDYGRFAKGDWADVMLADARGVTLLKDGLATHVAAACAPRFIVAAPHEIELSRGDRLQLKFNGKSAEGAPIRNGELVTVRRVLQDGRIAVRDDAGVRKTLAPSQRLFVPGHAVTSYTSQGKTVDTVLVSYGAGAGDESAGAATPVSVNRNQWYVAISRARKNAVVFTDDKESLRVRVEREADRQMALSVDLPPETMADIAQGFSEETKELIRMGAQAQRHAALMRWVQAVNAPVPAPDIAQAAEPSLHQHMEPHYYQEPDHQPAHGIRL
jgi:conjugative relaxase-like TrwC/TraI family protein